MTAQPSSHAAPMGDTKQNTSKQTLQDQKVYAFDFKVRIESEITSAEIKLCSAGKRDKDLVPKQAAAAPLALTLACLLNVLADGLRDELGHQVLEVAAASLTGHDLNHLLTDCTDLNTKAATAIYKSKGKASKAKGQTNLGYRSSNSTIHMSATWL